VKIPLFKGFELALKSIQKYRGSLEKSEWSQLQLLGGSTGSNGNSIYFHLQKSQHSLYSF
jgi:hypothetical protein